MLEHQYQSRIGVISQNGSPIVDATYKMSTISATGSSSKEHTPVCYKVGYWHIMSQHVGHRNIGCIKSFFFPQ
jgi:hypothetical protein